jgi:hypothetical protein
MKRASILVLAGFALATIVAACGKEGDLDRPGPMWGPKSRADYSAAKRDQAEQASNSAAAGDPGQPPAQGPGSNPYANPAPPSQAPIPGERTNPSGATSNAPPP